jgi:hypothetical protein
MKSVKIIAAAALTLLVASTSHAAPILVAGSTYDFYIDGGISGNASDRTATVDGVAEAYTRGGLNLLLNELQTDLGSGNHLISIQLTANGSLFPVAGETAEVGVGVFNNPLNFVTPVHLIDARINLFAQSSLVFKSANLADDYRTQFFLDPWSGFFPQNNGVFGIGNAGGAGVDRIQLDFTVAEIAAVPEPATLTLLGLGLSGLAVRHRRSRQVKVD